MKKLLLILSLIATVGTIHGQQWVNLELNHLWNGQALNYGDIVYDESGNALEITRVQYYLSRIKINHDNGQETQFEDVYVLGSGNISHYSLGYAEVTSLESLHFDLGVDQAHNHLDPNSYPSDHPLAPQNPNMHWGWSAGYKFLVIEGNVDSDGDQVPDKLFQFHAVGEDNYLQNVDPIYTEGSSTGSVLTVAVNVEVSNWLNSIDLIEAGTKHGVYPVIETMMTNTNNYPVFSAAGALGIGLQPEYNNMVFFNYSQPYAPVISYKFPRAGSSSLQISDMNGRILLRENNLAPEGNYFINRELAPGVYSAVFINDKNEKTVTKFIIRK